MNRPWILSIFLIAFALLLILKTHEKRSLSPYFKSERSLRLTQFEAVKKTASAQDLPFIELWESMLTGRVAPVDKWLKHEYKTLALAHVFTPSGFHLSALLWPMLFFFRKKSQKLWIFALIGCALSFLPGQSALKRMTMIKFQQQVLGLKTGFIVALILDVLWGTFSASPLGFTYSFLFLGIIYSGAKGFTLFVWFFCAQVLISFIQGSLLSPLLLFLSPLINSLLALFLPFLFFLAWPLTQWQLSFGIVILKLMQFFVSWSYNLVIRFPLLEVNIWLILLFALLLLRKWKLTLVASFLLTSDLNTERSKLKLSGTHEWQARGRIIKVVGEKIYREDGICKKELVKGVWFENCSPRRRSRDKKTKKLSYLFEEQRKSSLRELRT